MGRNTHPGIILGLRPGRIGTINDTLYDPREWGQLRPFGYPWQLQRNNQNTAEQQNEGRPDTNRRALKAANGRALTESGSLDISDSDEDASKGGRVGKSEGRIEAKKQDVQRR